jgi:hypothetical protein
MKKALLLILTIWLLGCTKEYYIVEKPKCETCTEYTKRAGVIKDSISYEVCDEMEIYNLQRGQRFITIEGIEYYIIIHCK